METTTFELIEKYVKANLLYEKEQTIDDYSINGSVITIVYSYQYDWSEDRMDRSYNNIITVSLLDYITFVFNCK